METTYFRTSREMLWHLISETDEFVRKDDLRNKTNEELIDFIVGVYDNMWNQLNNSEQ